MRGGTRGLNTATLIDSDIDDHRAFFHVLYHLTGDQLRSRSAGNQYAADQQICFRRYLANGI